MSALLRDDPVTVDWTAALRGRLRTGAVLAQRIWFQVGGPADFLFTPEDLDDLVVFQQTRPDELPLFVLGVGSNLLVRDGGIEGIVLRLGRAFAGIEAQPGDRIFAGSGALDVNVAEVAAASGIGGLEFLSGIPGTLGGALAMNAGAYGEEICNVLLEATLVDRQGAIRVMRPDELGYRYRHCDFPEGAVFVSGLLQGSPDDAADIRARMEKIAADREASQPVRARTGGSTFTNPPGEKAWSLIDRAGCRGMTIGQAQVSEKHCNFLLNLGGATASDLESLGETVRDRVETLTGIRLEWEIKRVGRAAE